METKLYGEIAPGGKWAPLLVLLALVVYVLGLWSYPLSDSESKYAEIPREMLERGDWITPRIDYVDYLSKPPLSFWATMVAYKVGGVSEFTGRLPNAIFALALAFVIGAIGRTLFGTRASTIATVLTLTTAELYAYTRECGVEMALVFFTALVHHCFLRWQRTEQRKWLAGAWASAGAAVLVKGPVAGVLFPGVTIFLYLLLTGQHAQFRRLFSWRGAITFLAIVLPWPIAMEVRHPGFLTTTVVRETLGRFLGNRLPNDSLYPTWYFLALCAMELYPWVGFLPHALLRGLREAKRKTYDGHCVVYLLAWSLLPLVVFSISKSKVDFYGLQSQPGLLLLVAWLWNKRFLGGEAAPSRRGMAGVYFLSAAGAVACLGVLALAPSSHWVERLALPPMPINWTIMTVAFAANLIAGIAVASGRLRLALGTVACMMVAAFVCIHLEFVRHTQWDSMQFATVDFRSATGQKVFVCDERPEFAYVANLAYAAKAPCFQLRDREHSQLEFESDDPRATRVIDEAGKKESLLALVQQGYDVFLVGEEPGTDERLARLGLKYKVQTRSGNRAVYRIRGKQQ